VLVANAVTYALMAVAVVVLVTGGGAGRERILIAMAAMDAAKVEVGEHFRQHGAFPPPRAIDVRRRHVKSLARERDGRLVLVFDFPDSPEADGKRVVLEPRVEGGRIEQWVCTSPDMPSRYLPMLCRGPSP